MSLKKMLIDELVKADIIKFGNFTLKSGQVSPIYFDMRMLVSFPELYDKIISQLLRFIDNDDVICGVPLAGITIATLLSAKTKQRQIFMRNTKKTHGTGKMIEGKWCKNEKVVLIDDVITSGLSFAEAERILNEHGLVCQKKIVLLDRRNNRSEKVFSLFTIEEILYHLHSIDKISLDDITKIFKRYTYEYMYDLTKNDLLKIMIDKKTNLCFSCDITDYYELRSVLPKIAPYVCMIKTHLDFYSGSDCREIKKLMKDFSKTYNFIWLEDRKFADIANTSVQQYRSQIFDRSKTYYYEDDKIHPDAVTVHTISGYDMINNMNNYTNTVLICEMSTKNNLCNDEYINSSFDILRSLNSNKSFAYVAQKGIRNPHFIHLVPGISLDSIDDNKGQQYKTPDIASLFGADVFIVGRGIIDNIKNIDSYKEKTWNAYLKFVCDTKFEPVIETTFLGLKFNNIFYNASGAWCTSKSELDDLSKSDSAIVLSKSCTSDKRSGNKRPKYYHNDTLSINSTGLENLGIDFYASYQPLNSKTYIVSIAGRTLSENMQMLEKINDCIHVSAVELNLSCPNLCGESQVAYDFPKMDYILESVFAKKWNFKIGLKLSPYFDSLHFIRAAEIINKYPIAFITCVNSLGNGLVINPSIDETVIHPNGGLGGIGGSVIKSIGLSNVFVFRQKLKSDIQLVGCGGIENGNDAYEYLLAGADILQIGTQLIKEGTGCFKRINNELKEIMRNKNIERIDNISKRLKIKSSE